MDAMAIEPVSARFSLPTGKTTGKMRNPGATSSGKPEVEG
jgi:hypothetical protein